ncbi:MAG TPA: NAD(P)H-dependent oxidoreductase subunit E, partial [Planctomycetota bacterium]|nr:NAD(P)H-dependent oxidoreductase subunit E [Planctomycetota bacterium]
MKTSATVVDPADIDRIVEQTGKTPDAVIPILRRIQMKYNWLPQEALKRVCETTQITPAAITGVSTFYSKFRHKPAGKHFVNVCVGTACHVKGAQLIIDGVRLSQKFRSGEDTDPEGNFTICEVACLGCCTLAPVVQIDDAIQGYLTSGTVGRMLSEYLARQKARKADGRGAAFPRMASETGTAEIRIGFGSCCIASGSKDVRERLERAVHELGADVRIKPVGCSGFCDQSPLVEVVDPDGQGGLYAKVEPDEAERIVRRHFQPRGLWGRFKAWGTSFLERLQNDKTWVPVTKYSLDTRDARVTEFLGRQRHIVTENYGQLDPLDLDDYERREGFKALRKVLAENDPEKVVKEVSESGLRGRGGGGFPTGRKWSLVRAAEGRPKVVIMNGDEGDPGAFMDRVVMECYPYRVLEGLMIAAFAVGADRGVLYIRAEYPLATERMAEAIQRMTARNLLGQNILGTGFNLEIKIM